MLLWFVTVAKCSVNQYLKLLEFKQEKLRIQLCVCLYCFINILGFFLDLYFCLLLLVFVDISLWLKSLRLHKYAHLFQNMTYEEMLNLNDEWLEKHVSLNR